MGAIDMFTSHTESSEIHKKFLQEVILMQKNTNKLQRLIVISLLSALAFLIMYVAFPLPLFPVFLTIDFSDIPALVGAIMYGPIAGIGIEFLKNSLHYLIKGSGTGVPVGEFANFLAGSVFIFFMAWIYSKMRSAKGLVFGMIAGTITMTVVMAIANYYIILPGYSLFLGLSINDTISFAGQANKNITDLFTLIVYGIAPFNLIKGFLVAVLMVPLYQRLKPRLKIS